MKPAGAANTKGKPMSMVERDEVDDKKTCAHAKTVTQFRSFGRYKSVWCAECGEFLSFEDTEPALKEET